MLTVKLWFTETRPTADIAFWERSQEDENYYTSVYKSTGILIYESVSFSTDTLIRTRTQVYNFTPELTDMLATDVYIAEVKQRNIAYNDANGILRSQLNFAMYNEQGDLVSEGILPEAP